MSTIIPLHVKNSAPKDQSQAIDDLAADLMNAIEGEVRFDDGARALYATDGSNYRQTPIGVVVPKSKDDIIKIVEICRKHEAPLLARGGGTSLAGQCCNIAVVMDTSKYYNHILYIDPEAKLARVQPGIVLDDLRREAALHGLTFGPDPATHTHCTLGGMMGNDSCGIHSVMAQFAGTGPRVADNVHSLEVLLYDGTQFEVASTTPDELEEIIKNGGRRGEVYRDLKSLRDRNADKIRDKFPPIPRRVSGYNLPELLPENNFNVARALIGSEGTLVTILEATLNLIPQPHSRSLLVLGYPDVFSAGDHAPEAMKHEPIGLEGMDEQLIEYMKKRGMHPDDVAMLPPGNGWLLVEFGGKDKDESDGKAQHLMEELKGKDNPPSMKLFTDREEEKKLWEVRESGLGATAFVPGVPLNWPGWEDSAVPPAKVGPYLRDLKKLFNDYGYKDVSVYGHFGQGCIHCRVPFDLMSEDGLETYHKFAEAAADLVVSYGGSLSGEHGDGQSRAELLPRMFGPQIMQAMGEMKTIFDPENRLNPGKVVNAYPILSNLRLGTDYNPAEPETFFQFPDDGGSFAHATLRCVGVGKCRREDAGLMCPSYQVTHEERDATRGRAHMLFEMLRGETIADGWKDEHVKESLDLCLACKGCKGQCPVKVDIATYKAEFLAHYYKGRLRPVHAYVFGLISQMSRFVFAVPYLRFLANFATQSPLLSSAFKGVVGVDQARRMPPFADQSFKEWFVARMTERGWKPTDENGVARTTIFDPNSSGPRVILFPDSFNNYFHPTTAQAACEVLEKAGCSVVVPLPFLCCGRPLYDYGMLGMAQDWLKKILAALREEIRQGTPMIVLEPSCCATFRDELTNLFPNDQDAQRLKSNTLLLSEYLHEHLKDWQAPKLERKAVVHGHCHHVSIMGMTDEIEILRSMGVDFDELDSGCCGMAGAFGFEKGEHYDVSIACGERVLLPAVRQANDDEILIADGFSCREQISQTTDRHALHLAEVLHLAQTQGERGPDESPDKFAASYPQQPSLLKTLAIIGAGAVAVGVGAVAAWNWWRGRE